ncbi:hypothetical protein ILUMI_23021 [Ignelater luminosus]|uniref:Uncharacterized protein n=1 Tax=Ignelater luminosus TaxID=2038154 RepID=A0A8K0G2B2_IGNLU|nr:hypothetical protein ILUMI_23021 [Ignelater luminosus]
MLTSDSAQSQKLGTVARCRRSRQSEKQDTTCRPVVCPLPKTGITPDTPVFTVSKIKYAFTLKKKLNIESILDIFKYSHGLRDFMNFKCDPGDRFKYGCNLCTCDESTRREVECRRIKRCIRFYKCTPFTSFESGCLPCTCQMNGWPFCKVERCWTKRLPKVEIQPKSKVNSSLLYFAFS